jgi:hypothetical protein
MTTEQLPRSCYCSLWETNPEFLQKQGLPHGYCGICDLCGDPGHTGHYPGPVPVTGAWCDVCYQVQAHKAPDRDPGAWCFNGETLEEEHSDYDSNLNKEKLQVLLSGLKAPRSALILEIPAKLSVDFFVRKDGLLDLEFGDHTRGLFGKSAVDLEVAKSILSILLEQRDIRQAVLPSGIYFEYYEDEPNNGEGG